MKSIALFFLLGIAGSFFLAKAAETPITYPDGIVTSMAVLPPMGTFLLARQKKTVCAIKFTEMWRGNDATGSNALHSGEESFRSRYVKYLGGRTSGTWIIDPVKKSGDSELTQGRLVGLGRLAFGTGKTRIDCGPFKLFWTAPAHVYFSSGKPSLLQDQGTEIALTKWTEIEQVDPNDPALLWLRYDKDRQESRIAR